MSDQAICEELRNTLFGKGIHDRKNRKSIDSLLIKYLGLDKSSLNDVRLNNNQLEKLKCIRDVNDNSPLMRVVTFKQYNSIDFLIRCGVNLNHKNKNGVKAIDIAENNGDYDIMLMLLKKDADFPEGFEKRFIDKLEKCSDSQKNSQEQRKIQDLKEFIKERKELHEYAGKGDLEKVEQFFIGSKQKSQYYMNTENQSVLMTAFNSHKWVTCISLQLKNLRFKREEIKKLQSRREERRTFRQTQLIYFPQIDKEHIYYLMSKTRIKNYTDDLKKIKIRIFNLYEKLDTIHEVSTILKVIYYVDDLNVVFDFDSSNINDIDFTGSLECYGRTYAKEGTIYIAGKRSKEEFLLGTTAHELTHYAMDVIFKNTRKPYFGHDTKNKIKFEGILENIKKLDSVKETLDKIIKREKVDQNSMTVLTQAFSSPRNEHINTEQKELIVRVPHILATFGRHGKKFFNEAQALNDLYLYFVEDVLPECKKFIKQSYLIKPRNIIQSLNESLGEVNNLKKLDIGIKKSVKFDEFVNNSDRQILLLRSKSTLLSCASIYETVLTLDNTLEDNCMILKFESFVKEKDQEILLDTFSGPVAKVLVLDYSRLSANAELKCNLEVLYTFFKNKEDLKVIFIVHEGDVADEVRDIFDELFEDKYIEEQDEEFKLTDLNPTTQNKVLSEEVMFQGESIILQEIDENIKEIIDTKTLGHLIKNEKIHVGNEPIGINDTNAAYIKVNEKIPEGTLLKLKDYNAIYLVSIIGKSNEKDIRKELMKKFNISDENAIGKLRVDALDNNKVILIKSSRMEESEFKEFCYTKRNTNIVVYWINWEEDEFKLQQLFDGDFYIRRNFQHEIVIKIDIKEILSQEKSNEKFIFTNVDSKKKFIESFKFDKKQMEVFKRNCDEENIQIFTSIMDSKEHFAMLSQPNEDLNIHLLEVKGIGPNMKLIWKNSLGSIIGISKYKDDNMDTFISENEFVNCLSHEKPILIIDEPGMGKSISLIKAVQKIMNSYWVIYISLRECSDAIINLPSNFNELNNKKVIQFLSKTGNLNSNEASSLTRELIEYKLENRTKNKPLAFLFDGFDEITDEKSENNRILKTKMSYLLKYLKTKVALWVTARQSDRETLLDCLSTFDTQFEEFDEAKQKLYLERFWKISSSLTFTNNESDNFQQKVDIYVDKWLKKISEIRNGPAAHILGLPLHLRLLGEVYQQQLMEFIKSNDKSPNLKELGILNLYENFIDKKFVDIYLKDKVSLGFGNITMSNMFIKSAKDEHVRLAFMEIFPDDINRLIEQNTLEELYRIGLVQPGKGKYFRFVHRTFAEYFIASQIRKYLKNEKRCPNDDVDYKLILNKVLEDKFEYKVIRFFFNMELKKDKTFNKNTLRQFGHNIIKETNFQLSIPKNTILHIAVLESNTEIFDFILKSLDTYPEKLKEYLTLLSKGSSGNVLHLISEKNNLNMLNLVLNSANGISKDFLQEFIYSFNSDKYNALDIFLIFNNETEIAEELLTRSDNKLKLITRVEGYEKQYNSLSIACWRKNNAFIETISKEFWNDKVALKNLFLHDNPLGLACINKGTNIKKIRSSIRDMEKILREKKSLLYKYMHISLTCAFKYGNHNKIVNALLKLFIRIDDNQVLEKIFLPENQFSPLSISCVEGENIGVVKMLLKAAGDIGEDNETLKKLLLREENYTPLTLACRYGKKFEIEKLLLKFAKHIKDGNVTIRKMLSIEGQSLLFFACRKSKNAVEMLLKEAAAIGDNKETLKKLLLLHKDSYSFLETICVNGGRRNMKALEIFLDYAKSIKDENETFKRILLMEYQGKSLPYIIRVCKESQSPDVVEISLRAAQDIGVNKEILKNLLLHEDTYLTRIHENVLSTKILNILWKYANSIEDENATLRRLLLMMAWTCIHRGKRTTKIIKVLTEFAEGIGDGRLKGILLKGNDEKYPFDFAHLKYQNIDMINMLLRVAQDIDDSKETIKNLLLSKDYRNSLSLVSAYIKGENPEMVKELLEFASCINDQNETYKNLILGEESSETPLNAACKNKLENIVNWLLDAAKCISGSETLKMMLLPEGHNSPLSYACKEGNICIVEKLLEITAGMEENKETLKKLLLHKYKNDATELLTLSIACSDGGNYKIAVALLEAAKSIPDGNETYKNLLIGDSTGHYTNIITSPIAEKSPLCKACRKGNNIDIVNLLLKSAKDIGDDYKTLKTLLLRNNIALSDACYFEENIDVVKILLRTAQRIPDNNEVCKMLLIPKNYRSPLISACDNNPKTIEIVEELLAAAKSVQDNEETLKKMLLSDDRDDFDADPYEVLSRKGTAIHVAAVNGNVKIVKLLLNEANQLNDLTLENMILNTYNITAMRVILQLSKEILENSARTQRIIKKAEQRYQQISFEKKVYQIKKDFKLWAERSDPDGVEHVKRILEETKISNDRPDEVIRILLQHAGRNALRNAYRCSRFDFIKTLFLYAMNIEDKGETLKFLIQSISFKEYYSPINYSEWLLSDLEPIDRIRMKEVTKELILEAQNSDKMYLIAILEMIPKLFEPSVFPSVAFFNRYLMDNK